MENTFSYGKYIYIKTKCERRMIILSSVFLISLVSGLLIRNISVDKYIRDWSNSKNPISFFLYIIINIDIIYQLLK